MQQIFFQVSPILDFLVNQFTVLMVTIIGVVISEVALYYYFRRREKPRINISVSNEKDRLGFSVSTEKKVIRDARVRCNKINYAWENQDGAKIERKDLYVGDLPSTFYPFQVKLEYLEDITKYRRWIWDEEGGTGGIVASIIEAETKKTVFTAGYQIPQKATAMWVMGKFAGKPFYDLSIRIIGEGIEEVKDYSLHIGLNSLLIPVIKEGKPIMDNVQCGFQLKKK